MTNERFTAKRTGSCNRCGSDAVAWCRSFKTGRAYLVNVAADGTASRQDVHSATCAGTTGSKQEPAPTLKMVNGAPMLNACLALTGESCHCPSCEDAHVAAMAAEIALLRAELAEAKAAPIAPAPLTVESTLELAAIATPEPVAAPVPVVTTDMLESEQDHAYMEAYISANRAEIEHKLNRMLTNTYNKQAFENVAVLDKPEPAPVPEIIEALAEPKQADEEYFHDYDNKCACHSCDVYREMAEQEERQQRLAAEEKQRLATAPAPTERKRGKYLCTNAQCMVDSWVATVTPGKPHTCMQCGRIAKYTGLV